ncbi:MAG: Type 4 prepilin-like protein leader peptide-processing enzyme [candidate division WS6 bacterium GW2011_GWC1_36_11]|uniref:Type 4 prepilin-like protein leader peptide-processing enzyme n=2 Tax=Candidatus Dojkabacteria TaxID=74243 RepID=A0A0G0DUE0_9BACT|nr:MAG: Type 4 prepilin-like protein leader peptide-processing enzyme [candidate division WS6 bacterium GW2011_GWC1_36_11]KKQ04703.1 MAG: Type 4 prepilin-like protein leader peptide-processing enzyme [candidate division WS6 bacterium GW2011_WS6_36_26]KKQ11309.1 MAG: Type 4 prepilin-like protein leader peptide-processing enzyme [candidate division WS6 bacterium GW2011_GWE1_36_69]KKQ17904.1 MAG: Type 4 prepilin-like protein leader peptide-processing enzyme [candidate division WS6 bacterium GW2011_
MIIFYICIFFIGAALASFINATLYRIEKEFKWKALLTQNSHCEECEHPLSWIDLLPVLGFLINKGRCRYCNSKVNIYYPISEFILGTIFLLFFLYTVPFYMYIVILFLFILSTYDIKEFGIPKDLTHIFLALCLLIFLFTFDITKIYFPIAIGIFLILLNIFKKSFGLGDILIILGLGVLINKEQFIVFFWLSIIIALLYSLILILRKKINIKNAKVPMVPFLSIAFVISIIYGEFLWNHILKLLQM